MKINLGAIVDQEITLGSKIENFFQDIFRGNFMREIDCAHRKISTIAPKLTRK